MIRYENDCCGCDIPCIECGRKHNPHFYCDKCGEEFEPQELSWVGDEMICDDCMRTSMFRRVSYEDANE